MNFVEQTPLSDSGYSPWDGSFFREKFSLIAKVCAWMKYL